MNSFVKALLAVSNGPEDLERWFSFLGRLASIEKNNLLKKILSYPGLSSEQRCSVLDDIVAQDDQQKVMIRLLAKAGLFYQGRQIQERLQSLCDSKAQSLRGKIISDTEISEEVKLLVEEKFSNRLNKNVSLDWEKSATTVGFKAVVGSYQYSLTVDDVVGRLNEVLLRG